MSKLSIISDKQETTCSNSAVEVLTESNASILAERGFAGNVTMVTLGCSKNLVDSEVMLGALSKRGFRPITDPQNADLIVVNTCAFLQSAVQEGVEKILELSQLKKGGRLKKLIVAGCMVERYRSQLEETLPEVDRFISTDELLTVADDEVGTSKDCLSDARRPYFIYDESMPRLRSTAGHTAYVKIAEGCNRPCAFCIIPRIRGALRSRSIESVISEVRNLLTDGVKEINFVAQDLTAYGTDFPGNRGIKPELSRLISEITKLSEQFDPFWLRLFYAYPVGVNEELMKQISQSPVVCNYLDLPLQHISHNVLKNMKRPLGEKGTRTLIEKMREIAPEVMIRTTFVVGFPGEKEEDVRLLEEFVAEGHFGHVGVFTYSQEEEAEAYNFPEQVEDEVKEERRHRIMRVQQEVVNKRLSQYIGKKQKVLIDGLHEECELLISARTQWQGPEADGLVIINEIEENLISRFGDNLLTSINGNFGEVEISEVAGYDLVGKLVEIE